MEGYSVTEAASVLGVTTERVWELLARGVLAGASDADVGMRVFLQPRPAPAPGPIDRPAANGGTGTPSGPERELSPFRELLTEFRNLTERYGQALLALGEARGEVAALRSRVDLLEARMDLRLPLGSAMGIPTGPMPAWDAPEPSVAAEPGPAPAEAPHDAADGEDDGDRRARRRRSGHRRATESFAEALARAEDPTAPELPAAASITHPPEADFSAPAGPGAEVALEAGLPRELPVADDIDVEPEPVIPVVDPAAEATAPAEPEAPAGEEAPAVPAEVAEDAVEAVSVEPPPVGVEAAASESGPAEFPEDSLEPVEAESADAAPVEPGPLEGESGDAAPVEPGPIEAEPVEAPIEAASAPEPEVESEPADRPPIEWDPERYTVDIAEPDWYAEESSEPAEPATEPSAEATDATPEPPAAMAEPPAAMAELAAPTVEPEAVEPRGPYRGEETMLWFGRPPGAEPGASGSGAGADEMEVVGRGERSEPAAGAREDLPGSGELGEALAALDALARPATEPAALGPEVDPAWPEEAPLVGAPRPIAGEPPPAPPSMPTLPPAPPAPPASSSDTPVRTATQPVTPAARAYRRLRRIFPG